ncbi:hydrocephalus-inducing protein-like [Molothrus aeneus]
MVKGAARSWGQGSGDIERCHRARHLPGPGAGSRAGTSGVRGPPGVPGPGPATTIGGRGCPGTAGAATAAVTALPPQVPAAVTALPPQVPAAVTALPPQLSLAAQKQSSFQVSPPELVFQNIVAHEVYEMALSLINKNKFPQVVKISMESSPYFQLMGSNDAYRVVLPGATVPVHVRFTPDESKDYCHEFICVTARERIVVPLRATGARVVLDLPAQLDFSECPVKVSTQKTLLICNTGNLEAHYQLSTQSPFSVVPTAGTLGAGDTMRVTVTFHPLTNGDHCRTLILHYDTPLCFVPGEERIHTKLHGEAVDVNIGLSTNSVEAGKTFITMSSHRTLFIENRSNITAHFQWKAFPTEEDENEEKRRQRPLLHPPSEARLEKFTEEKKMEKEKGSYEDRSALLSSMVQEKMAKVQEDSMLFSSDIFFIEPMEGEIGPHCSAEIKVIFKPLEALGYQSMAYCNISGRESRLPLHLRGEGQGPLIELSSPTLNLENVLVNTSHVCEVKLINQGVLDGPFTYITSTTDVGSLFKFEPEEGIIAAGGSQTLQISFHSTVLGSFEEEFQFSVAGSPMPAVLTIKGSVTAPSLEFDVDEINFGEISFGFPCTRRCRLTNSSPVPLTFQLRMSDDGTQPAVSSFDQIRKEGDPSWKEGIHFYLKPKEFTINPSQGTILPQGHQDIEVTLCSNTVMDFYQRMLVDLEGFGKGMSALVITARCLVPVLRVYPEILLYDECHPNVPYERKFLIANDTDLPGCYGLIPQQRKDNSPVFYSSPKPCGIVQPHSFAEIPVIIEVQTLDRHFTNVLIGVFGDERNPLARKPHCCAIEPSKGVIPAEGEVSVTVTATLDDTGLFSVPVRLFFGSNRCTAFWLVALSTGTTIVIDKPFSPELNLGYQFSLMPCIHQFKVTNRGHHFHRLFWSVECHSPSEQEGQSVSALSSPRDDSQGPKRASPVFGLEPLSMDLQPGQSEDMVLRGFSRIPQEVQDYVMCEAVSMITSRTEKIIETVLTCKFIHPSIEMSATHFSFRVNKKPSDVLRLKYQPLALKNTCMLPLDLMLDLERPFLVCDKKQQPLPGGQPVRVDVGETCHLYVAFDPAYELDFKTWKKEKILNINLVRGHPFVERIILWGEVHFPNLQMQPSSLEFGCIVAGAEEVRSLEMTNCSPLPVQYRWSFHSKSQVYRLRAAIALLALELSYKGRLCKVAVSSSQHRKWLVFQVPAETRGRYYIPLGLVGTMSPTDVLHTPLEAEEVFSILPLSGVLQPGESQQVSFTFCSHFNTISNVTALCHVEGGPTYEVVLTGETACISYSVSPRETNCGSQMFNAIHHSKVTLENTGKIEFNWVLKPSPADQHLPGVFLVNPTTGSVAPGEKQVLEFSYMPGFPGAFSRTYQLKVGDLEPENICLKGEASFPMITLNLPWNTKGKETHEKPLTQLIKPLQQYSQRNKSAVQKKTQTPKTETPKSLIPKTQDLQPSILDSGIVPNSQLQINMVRKLIEKAALELQEKLTSQPPKSSFPDRELCQSLVKVELPEYVLDMGTVRKGFTERSTLEITNHGQIPVSFQVNVSVLEDTGFSVDLDQVEGLPHSYIKKFDVRFESARRPRGDVDVLLPIEVTKGPTYNIRLHANVSELSIELSKNTLHYSAVVVGQCKVETIHLYNWFRVPCRWSVKPVQKVKHSLYWTPSCTRCAYSRKLGTALGAILKPALGRSAPRAASSAGASRTLTIESHCCNPYFWPRSYENELELNIYGSSNRLKLHLSGQGLEPRLEFRPPALEMGWMLVDSNGVEATVVVKNPCKFPIEFYALDFDEQYLEKEKVRRQILRMAVRSEDHEAQKRLKAELKARAEAEAKAMGKAAAAHHRTVLFNPESLLKETGSHRGMVVIVHGPPRAGKTEIAAGLCQYYDAACVSIDTVVKEAMAKDGSPAGLRARELCTQAAMEQKGKRPQLTAHRKNKEASGEKFNKKYAKGKNPPAQKKEPANRPNIKDTKFTVSTAPAPQQLNIISSRGEELNCLSCVLPEELLVDILSERLKQKDCSKGVIFDGLESLFTSSLESSLLCVLKAVKNRRHIYMVNLHQDYASWKAKDKAKRKKEAEREKEVLQRNTEHILQMDEDEYDALPEEKKAEMDKILQERKSTQTEGELKQPAQKLEEEAKALVEEERQKEEKKNVSLERQPAKPEKEIKAPEKDTKAPEKGAPKPPQKRGTKASGRGETKALEDPDENLILRFQIYESSQQDIAQVFSYWDRVQVEYPEERLGSAERVEPFTIVAPGGAAMGDNLAKAPDAKGSSAERRPKTGKVVSRVRSAKISTQRTESPRDSSATRSRSTLKVLERPSTPAAFLRLKRYRWKVPAQGEVELKVHFFAKKPGKFEQTLRFELVLSKRQYELPCSVTGLYPSISQNPRLVFPHWRETMEEDEIIFKEYVESTKQFHFGPLVCGKSREWYKAQNCPSNSENLTILNNSPTDAEVQFSFENDGEETFLLSPRRMTLKPKEKRELTIWAFPTCPGFLEDKLICSIGKNPEPVVFSLCCHGVDMKLEVSPLQLSFDKLLLHRTDSRTLVLKNNTLLPMAWQLSGLDDLAENFSLSQDNGILDPCSELEVTLHFKAEHIGNIEKILRLEVSDTENILGNVQAENIEISAEVYDVSLSIDMPEGPDGSLEFGTINVLDNVKKILSLQNKGVYNIEYSFTLKGTGPRMRDVASHFTVEPQSGVLIASQPGENVEMLFHPTSEIFLKNKPILYCQVADASPGRGRPAVANIPVRVSAEAEYSKYSIVPASPTDFGAMVMGTTKTRSVVVKNIGMADFKFCIRQAPKLACALEIKSSKQGESAPSATEHSTGKESSSLTQSHLNLGVFTVSPCCGSIRPCGLQVITVECLARQEGTCEEHLYIDIMGRDPKDNPHGIPFTLIAESCLPALVEDVALIFKEYPICSSTDLDRKLQLVECTGLFIRDENRFIFNKVLVGQEAEAHFRICNAGRLPCDVVLSILPGEEQIPVSNVFNLYPVKMSIRGSSCAVATVTFTPPDKQSYDCIFKASLVIPKGSVEIKPQILTFIISGKGQELPVTVVRPSARSKRGTAVLRFKRLQLEDSEILPLVLRNNGTTPVKFMLRLEDEHGVFLLKGRASTFKTSLAGSVEGDSIRNETKPSKQPFFLLRHGQSAQFNVIFKPTLAQRLEGKIGLLVGDVCMTLVELVGEGHKDEFTLDGLKEDTQERNAKSSLRKDIIDAVRVNHIEFGHCPVGKRCRRTFTITNHTLTQVMRFEWEADGPFQFSPKVGHLHPGCAKGITVILKADVPATFRRHLVKCKVTKINFELPRRKVLDWDDQMCIVTWKDITWKDPAARWPKREKVVEPVLEPAHTVLEESSQEAEVYLSAVIAYTQFKLSTTMVEFKDTLPFQTRTATFRLCNTGKVALEYYWEEAADSEAVKKPFSPALTRHFLSSETLRRCRKLLHRFGWQQESPFETHPFELRLLQQLAKQLQQQDSKQQLQQQDSKQQLEQQDHSKKLRRSKRVGSALEIFPDAIYSLPLFSIKPYHGIITPGQKQAFQVQFSPKCAGTFQTTLLCRIPNLNPAEKMRQVTVKGRAREQNILGRADRERPGSQEAGALESST